MEYKDVDSLLNEIERKDVNSDHEMILNSRYTYNVNKQIHDHLNRIIVLSGEFSDYIDNEMILFISRLGLDADYSKYVMLISIMYAVEINNIVNKEHIVELLIDYGIPTRNGIRQLTEISKTNQCWSKLWKKSYSKSMDL